MCMCLCRQNLKLNDQKRKWRIKQDKTRQPGRAKAGKHLLKSSIPLRSFLFPAITETITLTRQSAFSVSFFLTFIPLNIWSNADVIAVVQPWQASSNEDMPKLEHWTTTLWFMSFSWSEEHLPLPRKNPSKLQDWIDTLGWRSWKGSLQILHWSCPRKIFPDGSLFASRANALDRTMRAFWQQVVLGKPFQSLSFSWTSLHPPMGL